MAFASFRTGSMAAVSHATAFTSRRSSHGTRLRFFVNFSTERETPSTPHHTELQEILGYRFSNPLLLDEATLTRGGGPSVTPQNAHGNKPLALVGDALIRLDVGVRSYAEGTGTDESSFLLADIGSNKSLEAIAKQLDLDRFIIKNKSQKGAEASRVTLASTVEALIGAVWVDSRQDFNQVQSVIRNLGIECSKKQSAVVPSISVGGGGGPIWTKLG